jgi:hypothetical protein
MSAPTPIMRHNYRRRALVATAVVVAVLVYLLVNLVIDNQRRADVVSWGVTFSTKYAKELGLDWKRVYLATLDELKVKKIRLPIYWDEVQPQAGPYDFRDVDWMMDQANQRGAKVLLVVGRRVPRWPECHTPAWVSKQGVKFEDQQIIKLVAAEVAHFKDAPALEAWQLENEPLLGVFGECPPPDDELLGKERHTLKAIDARHPVVITDSGELSIWLPTALRADVLGISMYRVTWNKWFGYFYYPVTPAFYWKKAEALYPIVTKVIVTELQAEPWPSNQRSIPNTPLAEQYKSMNIKTFNNNIEFARRVGFPEVYLWGVEWWYWVKEKGNPDFWNAARALFAQ